MEIKNNTPSVWHLGTSFPMNYSVDEVGESLGWIYDHKTSGTLCFKNGIWVCDGGVALRGLGGVSGVVGIKLLPLATNLPLEYISLFISCFCLFFFF